MPIDQMSIDKNDAVIVFDGLSDGKVWVAAAFDQQGVMLGDTPPPSGTPIGILMGKDGMPGAITPGENAELTFNDSLRMP